MGIILFNFKIESSPISLFIRARETKNKFFGLILLQTQASLQSHHSMQYIHLKYMYEDFLFHSKSVHFLHIYPAMWRSTEKTGFVLFSVTLLFFAIPTALENIQRIKKENEKYHLRHIPTR